MTEASHTILTIIAVAAIIWVLPKLCRLIQKERVNNAKIAHDTQVYNATLAYFALMQEQVHEAPDGHAFTHDYVTVAVKELSPCIEKVRYTAGLNGYGTLHVIVQHDSLYFNQHIMIEKVLLSRVSGYIAEHKLKTNFS